jgi:chemotaxis protein MotB
MSWLQAQKQLADRDREIAALRSGSSDALRSAQADLDRSKTRSAELERQLANRDRELASLRPGAGDSAKMASQLEVTNSRNSAREAQLAAMGGAAADKDKPAAELAAAKQRETELEGQLADRDKELAGLRGELSAEMAKLKEAQRGLIRALRPQIEKGDITVDLNNERLLINLASHYLFATGEDALKPAGADALKQVGTILKDFPEYKVAVDGHTDNVPIRGELKK